MPTIEAKLMPEIVTDKSPLIIEIAAPPNPKTNIDEATTTFLDTSKSTLFLINTFKPLTAMKPYNNNDRSSKPYGGLEKKDKKHHHNKDHKKSKKK